MVVTPKVKGFVCITAHPQGCQKNVKNQINYVKDKQKVLGPQRVLVIGASTGYGLASRITASFAANAQTIGVFFERPATGKRTASAGWYNSAAFEEEAEKNGIYAKSINGDAFSNELKQQTIDLIKEDWPEGVDLIIYSLASPRRQDPVDNQTYQSVLKPVGNKFSDKTVNILSGEVSNIELEPANQDEIQNTIKVMGGEDWKLWIDALDSAGVLSKGVKTVAYSYIGPELTYPIYRNGTIGRAKEDLEKTALELDHVLSNKYQGKALVSVNKALVTQASSAIPVVPLYISLLYKEMKQENIHEGCIEQIYRLFSEYLFANNIKLDEKSRVRIDDLELRDDIQQKVNKLWQDVTTDNLASIADLDGYRAEFYQLFGFKVTGIDYDADTQTQVDIPSIQAITTS